MPTVADMTLAQAQAAVQQLEAVVRDLEVIDPSTISDLSSAAESLVSKVNAILAEIFGRDAPEYARAALEVSSFEPPPNASTAPAERVEAFASGQRRAAEKLKAEVGEIFPKRWGIPGAEVRAEAGNLTSSGTAGLVPPDQPAPPAFGMSSSVEAAASIAARVHRQTAALEQNQSPLPLIQDAPAALVGGSEPVAVTGTGGDVNIPATAGLTELAAKGEDSGVFFDREAAPSVERGPLPVQSFLVTTPLGVGNAALISLTMRFPEALHNLLGGLLPDVAAAGLGGWTVQPLTGGDALLDRLAEQHGQTGPAIRAAIVNALDERAAVLRFSDPQPLRLADLKQLKEGLFAFAKDPQKILVGAVIVSACIILIQVSWGVGGGLRATVEYAVNEIGHALVDRVTARVRSEATTQRSPGTDPEKNN